MEPPRMRDRSKILVVVVKSKAKEIASRHDHKMENGRKNNGLFTIIFVGEKEHRQTTHSATHTDRAKDHGPKELVEDIAPTGKEDDTCYQEEGLGQVRVDGV